MTYFCRFTRAHTYIHCLGLSVCASLSLSRSLSLSLSLSRSLSIYIYLYAPPPETHILYDFATKNTVSCCFCSRCETCPHRPTFCMTPPAGKVLVQVLFLLRPLLSVFVSAFIIRIVISIIILHKNDCYHRHCPCHVQYQYHHT